MPVAEAQPAHADDPQVREVIADLVRRVTAAEKKLAEVEKQNGEAAKKQAVTDEQLKHVATDADIERLYTAIAEHRAENKADIAELKVAVAKMETQVKADIAEVTVAVAEIETQVKVDIAKIETQNERNSKNHIMWIVGTTIALLGVIVAATGAILARLPS